MFYSKDTLFLYIKLWPAFLKQGSVRMVWLLNMKELFVTIPASSWAFVMGVGKGQRLATERKTIYMALG